MSTNSRLLRIVFIGPCNCGAKTSLIYCYVHGEFRDDLPTGLGAALDKKEITVEGENLELQIWGLLRPYSLFSNALCD